jgi:hypothetical protein
MDSDLLLHFQAAWVKIVRGPYFVVGLHIQSAQEISAQMRSGGQHEIDRLLECPIGR